VSEAVQLAAIAALSSISLALIAVLARRGSILLPGEQRSIDSVSPNGGIGMLYIHWNDTWHSVTEFRRWRIDQTAKTLIGVLACDQDESSALQLPLSSQKAVAILTWLATVSVELGRKTDPNIVGG